jgi:hypothetical protein
MSDNPNQSGAPTLQKEHVYVSQQKREQMLEELRALEYQTSQISDRLHIAMRSAPGRLELGNAFNVLLNKLQETLMEYDKLIDKVVKSNASR